MRHSLATAVAAIALMLTAGCAQSPDTRPEPQASAPPAPIATAAPVQAKPPVVQAPAVKPSPQVATPKPAPLDLTALEQRVRDTKAIGALTKISLKNQVDDLLDRFRSYYQGKLKTDLRELRRNYDLLVLKFVSLLQDDDPPLATAIVASREEIWGLLSDRTKFATL